MYWEANRPDSGVLLLQNISVTVFFILYGLLEVPSNLMLKKYGAKRWIPFIMCVAQISPPPSLLRRTVLC
jgi:hypothetical protein